MDEFGLTLATPTTGYPAYVNLSKGDPLRLTVRSEGAQDASVILLDRKQVNDLLAALQGMLA